MAWRCVWYPDRAAALAAGLAAGLHDIAPGALWPQGSLLEDPEGWELAPKYLASWRASRAPILCRTPGGLWCIDAKAYDRKKGGWHGDGWTITGEAPRLTAAPSIDIVGWYHGWLRDGVLSDDCEGRKFPQYPATA